jgi:transposase
MQTKLKTHEIEQNGNISFPIGTVQAVDRLYNILNFSKVLGKHKRKCVDLNQLNKAVISYKLKETFSIRSPYEWINKNKVLEMRIWNCLAKGHFTESLKILEITGNRLVLTSKMHFLREMTSSVPPSTWTGRVSSFMETKQVWENISTDGITDLTKSRLL